MYRKILLSLTIAAMTAGVSHAFSADYYASKSRLAEGTWVKVSTTTEGIYQLTYDQLKEMGFANPEKVQVYGYGSVALTELNNEWSSSFPDDIQPVATLHSNGKILFYGQGDAHYRSAEPNSNSYTAVRSTYDTKSCYFLSEASTVAKVPKVSSTLSDSYATVNSHIHVDFIEKEQSNPGRGGTVYHGPTHSPGDNVEYTFTIRDFQPSDKNPVGSFFYQYGIKSNVTMTLSSSLALDSRLTKKDSGTNSGASGTEDGVITHYNAYGRLAFQYDDAPQNVDEDFSFFVNIPSGSPTYCAEDFLMLRYPRANRLSEDVPFLVMNFPYGERNNGQKTVFENIKDVDDFEVWAIDRPSPAAFKTLVDEEDQAYIAIGESVAVAIAFIPSYTFPSPEVLGAVANQNIHGEETPEMVIITLADQMGPANELAELHRKYQGMKVLVLDQEKVFNEFSSGVRHAMAYRRLAKMFYDRDSGTFKHLMFLGPSYFDNRCVTTDYVDRLVVYEQDRADLSNSIVTNYAADTYFAMLEDNYVHKNIHSTRTQINIGRVPTLNAGQAATYVAKVRDRFENPLPPEVYNHILLMAGAGDNTKHSKQANEVIDYVKARNPRMAFSPVYTESYDPSIRGGLYNAAVAALNRGAGMMSYIGHGGPTYIEGYSVSEVNNTRYTYAPFLMLASCDQFAFDHSSNGLTSTMLVTENGGALGGVAAVRSVYIEQNQKTAIPVHIAYSTAKPGDTFGDIFRRSRDIILDDYKKNPSTYSDTGLRNMLAYNLAGDPAIPIGVPERSAHLTKIGNFEVSEQNITVNPLQATVFAGIIGENGEADESYNGEVRIEVYDGAHSTKTYPIGGQTNYTPNTVTFDSELLATGYGAVSNGKFFVEMSVPVPTFPADTYHVNISATSSSERATGSFDGLVIADFDPENYDDTDLDAPTIIEFYAGDSSFQTGDEVNAKTTIYALIDPSNSGLCTMTANVNTRTRLTVDGINQTTNLEGFLSRAEEGVLKLEVPMTELSDGTHVIELCVVNNAGKIDRKTIEVIATHRSLEPEITIAEVPAKSVATIDLNGVSISSNRLVVKDETGKTIFTKQNVTFPYEWNLKDGKGNDVADGLYKVSVLVQNDRDYGSTESADITVLR